MTLVWEKKKYLFIHANLETVNFYQLQILAVNECELFNETVQNVSNGRNVLSNRTKILRITGNHQTERQPTKKKTKSTIFEYINHFSTVERFALKLINYF